MKVLLKRLRQTMARTKRHALVNCAFLLIRTKSKSKTSKVCEKLEAEVRCEDTVFELPDELVGLLLEDLSHPSDPMRVARRLHDLGLSDSIAVVTGIGDYEKADKVFQKAQNILSDLEPGALGFSDIEVEAESKARLQLEAELAGAVGAGRLVTYYQPIFNLTHGTLTGFEALVRWDHPERGLLLPGEFLEIAELKGHLLKIDELVLKQALHQIDVWNKLAERPIYVSANLASDHFLNADNLTRLIETLNATTSALDLLRIDVSEQVLFDQNGIDSLKTLDMLRIGFNLDDFGVDSESFHCLGSFPFNSLKIDRTLICQMEDEVNAELIVAVLRIAKRMGMKTIAEGVVTHAQLEELRNLGCTEAQGFLFSEAVAVDEATELLNTEYRW